MHCLNSCVLRARIRDVDFAIVHMVSGAVMSRDPEVIPAENGVSEIPSKHYRNTSCKDVVPGKRKRDSLWRSGAVMGPKAAGMMKGPP